MKIGVLFDLDGVLIDSEGMYTEFWDGIGREFRTGIDDFAHAIKGTALTYILSLFAEDDREEVKLRIHDFEQTMVYPLFAGARELVDALRGAGIPMAIVTSSDDVKMGYLFKQQGWMETAFDAIINGAMVSRSKPDPQGYLMAAEAIGCRPEKCYVFEDSLQGIEAGHRAGAKVIGVATTNPREAIEGRADVIIDSISEMTVERLLSII